MGLDGIHPQVVRELKNVILRTSLIIPEMVW